MKAKVAAALKAHRREKSAARLRESADHARRSLAIAEDRLTKTSLASPIDGVVIERAVDQGQTVAASFSAPVLFRIAQDLSEIQIEANVDEADIGNVREGNPVTFTVDAYPDDEFAGVVSQVRLAAVELANVVTYTVIITADNLPMTRQQPVGLNSGHPIDAFF